jgi:polar amino acid transport system substrate-binding protein
MKRYLTWFLPMLLMMAACTCAPSEEPTSVTLPTTTPVPTPIYLPENATVGAHILARGYLIVGIRYDLPPFGFITEAGVPAGYGVDMGHEFARRWLGDEQAVEFRQVRTDTTVEHLQAGEVDVVITAVTHTQAREAGADFTLTYFVDGQALLVRTEDADAINHPQDLAGRPIGITSWSEAENALWAVVPFTPTLQTYDRFDSAVEALNAGEVDAVADLRQRLFWGRQLYPETTLVGQYTTLPVSIAYPQNDPFFANLVNLTFQQMVEDGTYSELYRQYFGPEYPPVVEQWSGDALPRLADAPLTTDPVDTIATIQARGRLAVAFVEHAPFAYYDENGVVVGYEASLVRQMAGYWLGDTTAVDFVVVTEQAGREMLNQGRVDLLIGGLPHTREAEMEVDFATTTYMGGQGLLVQAGTVITDLMSLDGHRVAVVSGGGAEDVLLAEAEMAGISVTVVQQPTLENAFVLLDEGQVVAIAGERADLLGPAYDRPGLGVLPLRFTQVPLAIGLPQGDSAFRDLVNLTLQALKAEGHFVTLYATWFDDTPIGLEVWPGVPYRTLSLR